MGVEYIVNESYPVYCCDDVVGRFEGSERLAALGNWQYFLTHSRYGWAFSFLNRVLNPSEISS